MTEILILNAIILPVLLALYNGYVINWKQNTDGKGPKWSKIWHVLGWWTRLVLHLAIFLETLGSHWCIILIWQLVAANFTWTVYDLIINKVRRADLWYIDYKGVNKLIIDAIGTKSLWTVRLLAILASLTSVILWYTLS